MSLTLQGAISEYAPPVIEGAAAGASAGGPLGGVLGAVVGLGSSLLGGLFKNNDNSSSVSKEEQMQATMFNHFLQQDNMRYQKDLNQMLMQDQFNYNATLAERQFEQNKWFAQNNMINSYNQLKQLGINPLLMSPQGSGGSTGLANVGSSSVSLGNTAAFDPANAVSANASSAQAKIARLNAFTNILDKVTDIKVKQANSALMGEQAQSEVNRRNLMDAESGLKMTERIGKQIDNLNAPEWWKARIKRENNEAEATIINAIANTIGSKAQATSAEAQMINATQGSPTKIIADYVNELFGDGKGNPISNTTKATKKSIESKFDNDYGNFNRLYGKYF